MSKSQNPSPIPLPASQFPLSQIILLSSLQPPLTDQEMSELAGSPVDVDRLSDLPEPILLHILSFLPTKSAVRTSLLSRRYCRLWTASPSMDFDRRDFPPGRAFTSAVSHCLRVRDPSAALVNFSLDSYNVCKNLAVKTASRWLSRAYSLGLRNLDLTIHNEDFQALFPLILTFHSLQSLKITSLDLDDNIRYPHTWQSLIPSNFLATGLRSLQITARVSCPDLKRLISEQTNLEDLCLQPSRDIGVDLVSRTVKTMKLYVHVCARHPEIILSFPALEVLDLTVCRHPYLKKFKVEMPRLKKVNFTLQSLTEESVPLFGDMLECFKNVSDLSIRIKNAYPKEPEQQPGLRRARRNIYLEKRQIHLLVAPGKDLPTFPYLRSLKLWMHFHEDGISDLICFLQNAPVLESVELHHKDNEYSKVEGGWKSRLPPDSEGNNEHAHFSNLHFSDRKIELIRRLLAICNEGPHRKKLKI